MHELETAIDKFVPSKMTKTCERPPWITHEVAKLLRKQRKPFDRQKGNAFASKVSKSYKSFKAFTQRAVPKEYWTFII